MRTGVFLFGGVEMPDAGSGPPAPTDRRYTQQQMWDATLQILDAGVAAEQAGFDSFWWTEHHFQHEGYEVIPNGLMLAAVLAERTQRIRIGSMFNIVGQWNPLRLAEDFATMHNLSKGRGILGVGRGTVPREAQTLGTRIGSFDNPDKAADDEFNRAQFDEAMEVIRLAFANESFRFHGDHFSFPPPGIPDRGGTVQELTLVPRPLYPFETWQAITSPPTLDAVPKKGFGGVMWLKHFQFMKQYWDRYAAVYEDTHGRTLAPGEKRMLVICPRIEDTHEEAWRTARNGHDEFWKFLGPYGWSRGYMGPDGKPSPAGLIPTLEESVDNRVWIIGSPDEVVEQMRWYIDYLGGVTDLSLFINFPGDSYKQTQEQMFRWSEQVAPHL